MFPLRTFHLLVYQWQVVVDKPLLELLECNVSETNCTKVDGVSSESTNLLHSNHWNEVTILVDDGEVSSCCIFVWACMYVCSILSFPFLVFFIHHTCMEMVIVKESGQFCVFPLFNMYHYLVGKAESPTQMMPLFLVLCLIWSLRIRAIETSWSGSCMLQHMAEIIVRSGRDWRILIQHFLYTVGKIFSR